MMRAPSRVGTVLLMAATTWFFTVAKASAQVVDRDQVLTRIAFGSCAHHDKPQPIWSAIAAANPDVFLFIGDNVYADTRDPAKMQQCYDMLASKPEFRAFRAQFPILATWDDHDYGEDNAGAEYPMKLESKRIFCDFFGIPETSPVHKRPGIYQSFAFGPPAKRVQIILLDTRTFRGPLREKAFVLPGRGPYVPQTDPSASLLGAAQWEWLETELLTPARLRIIVSSIQVIPEEHRWEKWANLPHERRRLLGLFANHGIDSVFFISGDRHFAEISRLADGVAYPLYELTSSGLNSARRRNQDEANRHRIPETNFHDDNFGMITVAWDEDDPRITLEIRNLDGNVARHTTFRLRDIAAR